MVSVCVIVVLLEIKQPKRITLGTLVQFQDHLTFDAGFSSKQSTGAKLF